MTITLEYHDLQFDDDAAVLRAEEGDFHYELLFAHLTFRVDETDLSLASERVPLLDVSLGLRALAASLADGDSAEWESPLSWLALTFSRAGERVAVSANYTEATATAAIGDLRRTTVAFHAQVMQDLLVRYPALTENPGAQKFIAAARESAGA